MRTGEDELQVVIVEDHPSVRRGLEVLLPRLGFRITGSAESAAEGERMLLMRRPDAAVVDIDLAGEDGTQLAERVSGEHGIPVVLYTGLGDPERLADAVHSGAGGIALKSGAIEDLAAALRAVAVGDSYIDPAVAQIIGRQTRKQGAISPREAEVLELLAQGLSGHEVAERLFLSPQTVETHVRNAVRKLGARGRLHAVILALQEGAIRLPGEPVGLTSDD